MTFLLLLLQPIADRLTGLDMIEQAMTYSVNSSFLSRTPTSPKGTAPSTCPAWAFFVWPFRERRRASRFSLLVAESLPGDGAREGRERAPTV